jgi:hypothetical protein
VWVQPTADAAQRLACLLQGEQSKDASTIAYVDTAEIRSQASTWLFDIKDGATIESLIFPVSPA